MLAPDQREIPSSLPDLVGDDLTRGASDRIVANGDVDQRIAEDVALVHSDAGAIQILRARNGLLCHAAAAVGMIEAKAGFESRARTENMGPGSTVVSDVELAHLGYVRVEVGVAQICVLLAVAKEKRVAWIEIVVPAGVEQVAVVGLAAISGQVLNYARPVRQRNHQFKGRRNSRINARLRNDVVRETGSPIIGVAISG